MCDTALHHTLDGDPITANCRLVVIGGPAPGGEVKLTREMPVMVGKGSGSDLQVLDHTVSRHHLTITTHDAGFLVEDAGSRNGTFIGGVRVERAVLVPGATLRIGTSILRILPDGETDRVNPSPRTRFGELVARSVRMREVFALLERVAPTDVTVLVRGETGTGKELAVRSIHQFSARARKPFVIFDCAGVAPNLIEAQLFGYVKGAYTGATTDTPGIFERANGGTVFIDEIGELPLKLQPRLLRVLDSRTVRRLGTTREIPVDVRVVAATNRNLTKMVREKKFRQDLFYRLSVVEVTLPSLRSRMEDLEPLVRHFLVSRGWEPDVDLESDNLEDLKSHSWPGNVRELRNVIDRAVSLGGMPGLPFDQLRIEVEEPGREVTSPKIDYALPYRDAKQAANDRFELDYLKSLMLRYGKNLSRAARGAAMDRGHLRKLLKRHGLLNGRKKEDSKHTSKSGGSDHHRRDGVLTEPGLS
jgi:transcriptional regulator with PAS, ATPase and Fis domain